jgi:hypothetical protein
VAKNIKMKTSADIKNEINEISPFLSQLKKENAFQASDDYFNSLADRIQQKVNTESKAQKSFNIFTYFNPSKWAAAAALIIILSIPTIYYYHFHYNQKISIAKNSTIYWDEVLNENNAVIDKMDENMLVEVLASENPDYNANIKKAVNAENKNIQQDLSNYIDTKYNNDVFNEL